MMLGSTSVRSISQEQKLRLQEVKSSNLQRETQSGGANLFFFFSAFKQCIYLSNCLTAGMSAHWKEIKRGRWFNRKEAWCDGVTNEGPG